MGPWHLFVMRNHSAYLCSQRLSAKVVPRVTIISHVGDQLLLNWLEETRPLSREFLTHANMKINCPCAKGNTWFAFLVAAGSLGVLLVSWQCWSPASCRRTSDGEITFFCNWFSALLLPCVSLGTRSFSAVFSSMDRWAMIWASCLTLSFP